MSENCVFRPIRTILGGHFSDILSTFLFSGLSSDLPVTGYKVKVWFRPVQIRWRPPRNHVFSKVQGVPDSKIGLESG